MHSISRNIEWFITNHYITFLQQYLGEYPDRHFTDQKSLEAMESYNAALKEISNTIQKRNEGLDIPYIYLLPERVPNSIAI